MAAFQYKRPSAAAMEKRATQQGGQFDSFLRDEFRTYGVKKGDNAIRILPRNASEEADHYAEDIWVHFGIGPDRGAILCMQKMTNEPCAACEERSMCERRGDQEAADELKPTRRCLVWLVDRKKEEDGPVLWAMPWTVDRDIAKVAKDRETGRYYFIDDPEEGYEVYFDREGEPPQVKYVGIQLGRRPTSVRPEWLEYIAEHPLLDTLRIRTYEEVQALLSGASATEAPRPAPATERSPPPRDERPPAEEPRRAPPPEAEAKKESPWEGDKQAAEAQQEHPPAAEEHAPPAGSAAPPSGASRAAELKARFARRSAA